MALRIPIFLMLPLLILLLLVVVAVIVLFIKLCSKRPWIAAVAVLALLLLLVPAFFLFSVRSVRRHAVVSQAAITSRVEDTSTAIWLPGIEDEFKANVYPSKNSAVRSLGLRIDEPVRQLFGPQKLPGSIILFQGAHDRDLIEEFGRAVAQAIPHVKWSIESETVAVQTDEAGIRLDIMNVQTHPAAWLGESNTTITSGAIQASVLASNKQVSIKADFVDKPWVEDLAGFLNTKPNSRFIIAKSTDSCVTEAEANRQAVEHACTQVAKMLGKASQRLSGVPNPFNQKVFSKDILEGGFILDRFVQSFEGTAGKIWRQALLIDASAGKLKQLAQRKALIAREKKTTWVNMFLSIIGLLVLISLVYAFLNAATKGYYVWSLRIAGIALALVVIILFLA